MNQILLHCVPFFRSDSFSSVLRISLFKFITGSVSKLFTSFWAIYTSELYLWSKNGTFSTPSFSTSYIHCKYTCRKVKAWIIKNDLLLRAFRWQKFLNCKRPALKLFEIGAAWPWFMWRYITIAWVRLILDIAVSHITSSFSFVVLTIS